MNSSVAVIFAVFTVSAVILQHSEADGVICGMLLDFVVMSLGYINS